MWHKPEKKKKSEEEQNHHRHPHKVSEAWDASALVSFTKRVPLYDLSGYNSYVLGSILIMLFLFLLYKLVTTYKMCSDPYCCISNAFISMTQSRFVVIEIIYVFSLLKSPQI